MCSLTGEHHKKRARIGQKRSADLDKAGAPGLYYIRREEAAGDGWFPLLVYIFKNSNRSGSSRAVTSFGYRRLYDGGVRRVGTAR